VFPRASLAAMKKEGGVIVYLPSIGVVGREQDGSKHYMMCDGCEQHLGDAENHMLRVGRDLRLGQDQPYDPELLARAALGLALKCHHSRAPEYRQFVLNKRQVATLRRWILQGYQPGR